MSREFGDHGSGFFHEKIRNSHEDAMDGRTNGAKLMAAILEPLVSIAYAVSSEEAFDSDEAIVVQAVFDDLPAIKRAVYAMEKFIRPARELAVKELAKLLRGNATVAKLDRKGEWEVVVKGAIPDGCESDVLHDAICSLVGVNNQWSGSLWSSGGDSVTHYVCSWDSTCAMNWLQAENERLKRELAAAQIGVKS